MRLLLISVFCTMQALAQILFKYGSLHKDRWTLFFILGNIFGASSIWFLMMLYRLMNVNVALGIAAGGASLTCQLALAMVYKSWPTSLQSLGILVTIVGMIMIAAGGQGNGQ